MQERENNKEKEPEPDVGTTSYKRKSKKLNFFDNESNYSIDETFKRQKHKINHSRDSSDNCPRTRKY